MVNITQEEKEFLDALMVEAEEEAEEDEE